MDTNSGVATDTGIPWKLPGDAAYFEKQTTTGVILMGWATYNEFAAPLHGRQNYVLTRDQSRLRSGFQASASLDDLITSHPNEDVWVIGGAFVFAETIERADELFLTQVLQDFHCTKFFPDYRTRIHQVRKEPAPGRGRRPIPIREMAPEHRTAVCTLTQRWRPAMMRGVRQALVPAAGLTGS